MAGTADDEDYYVPPGTAIIMSYGPDGPGTQSVDSELCKRPTREHVAAEIGALLESERKIYRDTLASRSIPSLQHRTSLAAARTHADIPPLPSSAQQDIEITLDDLLQEDE